MATSHPHLKEARASEDRKIKAVCSEAVGGKIKPNEYGEKPAPEDRAQQR